jgi:hypothetical protein
MWLQVSLNHTAAAVNERTDLDPRRRMRPSIRLLLLLSLAVFAVQGCSDGADYGEAGSAPSEPGYPFPTNANGNTYGKVIYAPSPDLEPDLIGVQTDEGISAYVWKVELDEASGALATSAAEIAALAERRQTAELAVFKTAMTACFTTPSPLSEEEWTELLDLAKLIRGEGVVPENFDPTETLARVQVILSGWLSQDSLGAAQAEGIFRDSVDEAFSTSAGRIRAYDSDGTTPLGWFSGVGR